MKKILKYKKILLLIILFLLLSGCKPTETKEEIIIGVAWPFTALDSLFDEGVELAVQEINHSGGIHGKSLKLRKEDDRGELVRGIDIAQSFAEDASIQAVIGHANSFISIPAASIYNNAGLVMLSPASTAPDLTKHGLEHIFRNIPSDDEIARQLVAYLAKEGHQKMVIYYGDDSYGTGLANAFEDYAKAEGIMIVDRFSYYNNLEDLKRLFRRWQAFGVDGIFIAKTFLEGGQFIADAGQAGINLPFIAGNSLDNSLLSQVGDAAEGTIVGSVFNLDSDRPETVDFVKRFKEVYQEAPSAYGALGYDAVYLLAAAIAKSDLQNRSTVADALKDLGKVRGVAGTYEFDEKGDNIGDLVVLKRLQHGTFTYIDR